MIVGLFLRYFKTYDGINYIPISDKENFCSLVGANGIGKSSVLEALDCFFNNKAWNYNSIVKKSGLKTTRPHIVPVFLLGKDEGTLLDHKDKLEIVDSYVKSVGKADASNSSIMKAMDEFLAHREKLIKYINIDEYYLFPLGLDCENNVSFSVFNSKKLAYNLKVSDEDSEKKGGLENDEFKSLLPIVTSLKSTIDYIYIPREIDPETFTKLETNEIQALMGETLNEVLRREVPDSKVREINTSLNSFIDKISEELDVYSYRSPGSRQQNLKKADLYQLIIEAFFSIRKLHKKLGSNWLEISQLSSGEKQKAIIDVAHSLLKNHRDNTNNLILAIDEPESSLHMSSCFDQFDSLHQISKDCKQVIISTHWYGFFPTIDNGNATIITQADSDHMFDLLNLAGYREEIKQSVASSKGKLPYDIRLKSTNDLIQSIITSSIGESPYNWLICEGSSEKVYFEKYFKDLKDSKKLRIVPVGGAKEIKRIYYHLATAYEDFKNEITGKIVLISDTDADLVDYEVKDYPNLICKRIVGDSKNSNTKLVSIHSNPKSPKTEIEDSLSAKVFKEALLTMKGDEWPTLDFIQNIDVTDNQEVYFAFDLKLSQAEILSSFLDTDNHKYIIANLYVDLLDNYPDETPTWISEIYSWY